MEICIWLCLILPMFCSVIMDILLLIYCMGNRLTRTELGVVVVKEIRKKNLCCLVILKKYTYFFGRKPATCQLAKNFKLYCRKYLEVFFFF